MRQRVQAFRDGFRHNLALVGPPGSGKTFKLHQLLQEQPGGLLIIYCQQYRESCRSFLQRFAAAILDAGLARARTPAGTAASETSLEDLLRRAQTHLPKTAAALGTLEGLLTRRLYGEALNRTLDAIPVLIEERRAPCVLILDEFLFLEELGLGHAFHELGKRVMTWPTTLFVLASSSPYRARTILRERLQLLFGQFELITIDPPDPRHAAAWLRQELGTLRGAKTVSPFLIRWLGAHPWYLSVFLKRFKELATLRQAKELTAPLFIQTAWDVLGSSEGLLHQWCASKTESLAHLRTGARAVEVLMEVA
ncbi:MAG TPA: ATP-binding protein, partial [archaeon]|nr:ATP-binding protein [archaeon]